MKLDLRNIAFYAGLFMSLSVIGCSSDADNEPLPASTSSDQLPSTTETTAPPSSSWIFQLNVADRALPCDMSILRDRVTILEFKHDPDTSVLSWKVRAKQDLGLADFVDSHDFAFVDAENRPQQKNGLMIKPLKDVKSGSTFTIIMEGFRRIKKLPEGVLKIVVTNGS